MALSQNQDLHIWSSFGTVFKEKSFSNPSLSKSTPSPPSHVSHKKCTHLSFSKGKKYSPHPVCQLLNLSPPVKKKKKSTNCSVVSDSCNPVDCSPPGSSVHGILQARTLEWVAMPFFRGIFTTKGSNPHLLRCTWIPSGPSSQGSLTSC